MIKILIVILVLAFGISLGRCGRGGSNSSGGCSRYPYSCIEPDAPVYFGPQDDEPEPVAPVYFGPQDDEPEPDAPVYFGPQDEDDDINNTSSGYPGTVDEPVDVYFGPQD